MTDALLAVILALFAADAYTTIRILNAGGVEKNKALNWLMGALGRNEALVVMKVAAFAACLMYPATWFLLLVIALYAAVVTHNWRQMRGV